MENVSDRINSSLDPAPLGNASSAFPALESYSGRNAGKEGGHDRAGRTGSEQVDGEGRGERGGDWSSSPRESTALIRSALFSRRRLFRGARDAPPDVKTRSFDREERR